jgi:hypothetical protein
LNLSPSALFLISRYEQPEIADAVIKAAKERHLGRDEAKAIIDKTLAGLNVGAQSRSRWGVNPRDQVDLTFTAAVTTLDRLTKTGQADRFAKTCVFQQFPDTDFGNSRTAISVIPGQGFR